MAGRPGGTGGIPTQYSQAKIGLSLFDLDADIGKSKNIIKRNPKVAQKLIDLGRLDQGMKQSKRQPGKI